MTNKEIRRQARAEGVPLWRLAAEAGISEPTLTRWMRAPLEGERLDKVSAALQRLIEQERRRDDDENK